MEYIKRQVKELAQRQPANVQLTDPLLFPGVLTRAFEVTSALHSRPHYYADASLNFHFSDLHEQNWLMVSDSGSFKALILSLHFYRTSFSKTRHWTELGLSKTLHIIPTYLSKIYLHFTLPSMPRSPKWFLSLKLKFCITHGCDTHCPSLYSESNYPKVPRVSSLHKGIKPLSAICCHTSWISQHSNVEINLTATQTQNIYIILLCSLIFRDGEIYVSNGLFQWLSI